jgi:hypothetical protein
MSKTHSDVPLFDDIVSDNLLFTRMIHQKVLNVDELEKTVWLLFHCGEDGRVNDEEWADLLDELRAVGDKSCDICIDLRAQIKDLSGRGASGLAGGAQVLCFSVMRPNVNEAVFCDSSATNVEISVQS